MSAPRLDRAGALDRLGAETFDLLVVGAGVTGAGVALDAALRGLSVALVDRGDIAAGTSQWSSKLVHGGLRYLAQGDVGLMREALAERTVLRRIAPHLVRPLGLVVPFYNLRERAWLGLGIVIYEHLAGLGGLPRHRRLSRAATLAAIGTLRADRVGGGFLYYDGRTDDARLALAIARSAAGAGAAVVNHAPVTAMLRDGSGRIAGAVVAPAGGAPVEVRARQVIAATGVWTDELRALAFGQTEPRLRPSKGVHLVVDAARLRLAHAGFLPAPERGRFVFLIPWGERAIVGTTDADHAGGLDAPHATPDDVRYLLDVVNRWTDADLSPADVVSTYAGLRPLVAGRAGASADLSRGHRVAEEGDGLVTIIGGKLTTYRRMARDAVDAVADRLGASRAPATDRHVLVGGAMPTGADLRALRDRAADLRLPMGALRQALWGHGAETARLLDRIRANPALASPLSEGLPWTVADAAVAVSDEAALTVEDVLMRRTKVGLQARDGGVSAVSAVALLLGLDPAAERAAWAARVAAERARWAGPAEPAR